MRYRTQRGGCVNCPLNLQANLSRNLSPVLPPGGGYEPGCTNGLRGGYYYNLNCENGCHPHSTVGESWPGYDGKIEKWAQTKFSGGRRKKSRRRRRTRRRRKQRGGSAPVGPGVGASIRPPPIKQFLGKMVTGIRKMSPSAITNLTRAGAYRGNEIKHAYYGEESGRMPADRSPDPMDQPIAGGESTIIDNLPQPGFEKGDQNQPDEDINIKMDDMPAAGAKGEQ